MADSKSRYSGAANKFSDSRHQNKRNAKRYERSKEREKKYNNNWKKNPVDLNEIVKKFTPEASGASKGVKYEFKNDKYIIKADMASGYLRIYDREAKAYVKLDGKKGNNNETHFKIKKKKG
ncbi:MAG: hypothetical protein K6E58_01160 [Eubacterium sp.]|nr:hypothetical protein [Eubacterium sp.]